MLSELVNWGTYALDTGNTLFGGTPTTGSVRTKGEIARKHRGVSDNNRYQMSGTRYQVSSTSLLLGGLLLLLIVKGD